MTLLALCHTRWTLSTNCTRRFLSTITSPPELQPIIGLEIHAQFNSTRKLFSSISSGSLCVDVVLAAPNGNQAAPNTAVGYHDIGLPGSLPVLNKEAILLAVKAALAVGCTVNPRKQ